MEVIEIAVEKLLKFWKDQQIVSVGNSLDDILNFEFSRSMQLPDDFRRLFMMTNGMINLFPNDFDEEGYLFYPLQELARLEDEFELSRQSYTEHCLIFAEYMHKSWWYGVKFSKFESEYEIGIISSADKFKAITRNLGEFIYLYMNDSPVLYKY